MNRFFTLNPVVLVLFVSLLTNGLAWAFHGEVFMHELGHDHQHTISTAQPNNEFSDEKNLDLSLHICFDSVYQPFVFTKLLLLPVVAGKVILTKFISFQTPSNIPDLPFRPPRSIFSS